MSHDHLCVCTKVGGCYSEEHKCICVDDKFYICNSDDCSQMSKYKSCELCRSKTMKMCSECYKANYCSVMCQKRDWKNHKNICNWKK